MRIFQNILLLVCLPLMACGEKDVFTIDVPPAYVGPVHIDLKSGDDAKRLVTVDGTGHGTMVILAKNPEAVIQGVSRDDIKDLHQSYARTGDGYVVTGTVDFTIVRRP